MSSGRRRGCGIVRALIFALVTHHSLLVTERAHAVRPLPSAGARALALGGAYTAEDQDVNVLFFNPAGLTGLTGTQISGNYGRFDPGGGSVVTEVHGAFGLPADFQGVPIGAAGGFMSQSLASGVHFFDAFAGFGMDVPTRGLVPWPVRGGGALRVRQQKGGEVYPAVGKNEFGLGLDGGALIQFSENAAAGVALRDLFSGGVHPAGPQFRVGGRWSHRRRLNLLGDIEFRKVTVLHAGAEWVLIRDLLKLRLGNGFTSGNVSHVALGAGFNFSPTQIDVAYVIPLKTFNDPSDQFRVSAVYRFNAPKFSELYYDRALDLADDVDRRVTALEEKEAQLKVLVADLEQARRLAEEELARASVRRTESRRGLEDEILRAETRAREAERRAQELEAKVRAAEEKIRKAEKLGAPRPAPAPEKPKVRSHDVRPGDSLRSLAEKYYGDAERWKVIYDANAAKVDRGRLVPGTTLVIPE
jgi:hypothetical protein